jgi:hypothetical protein
MHEKLAIRKASPYVNGVDSIVEEEISRIKSRADL